MGCFNIVTFFFVAIQFCHIIADVPGDVVEKYVGESLELVIQMPKNISILNYTAILDGPTEHEFHTSNSSGDSLMRGLFNEEDYTFTYELKEINSTKFGKWNFVTKYRNERGEEKEQTNILYLYDAKLYEQKAEQTLNVTEGEYVDLSLGPDVVNDTVCSLQRQDKILRKYGVFKNKTYDEGDPELYSIKKGECGFRIKVNNNAIGKWRIIGTFGYTTKYIDFSMTVKSTDELHGSDFEQTWILGFEEKINLPVVKHNVNYCRLQKPNGEKIMLKAPECTFKINAVSKSDEGIWTLTYSSNVLREDKIQYKITVLDLLGTGAQSIPDETSTVSPEIIDLTIFDSQTKRIWTEGSEEKIYLPVVRGNVNYCQLQKPNGDKIMLKTPECTFTINEVSKSDSGIWTLTYSSKVLKEIKIQYNISVRDSLKTGAQSELNKSSIISESSKNKQETFWTFIYFVIKPVVSILLLCFTLAILGFIYMKSRNSKIHVADSNRLEKC